MAGSDYGSFKANVFLRTFFTVTLFLRQHYLFTSCCRIVNIRVHYTRPIYCYERTRRAYGSKSKDSLQQRDTTLHMCVRGSYTNTYRQTLYYSDTACLDIVQTRYRHTGCSGACPRARERCSRPRIVPLPTNNKSKLKLVALKYAQLTSYEL